MESSTVDAPGRVAIVTGGSGAIGAAIASVLAGLGLRTCLVGRDLERLRAVAHGLARSTAVEIVAADLGTEDGLRAVTDAASALRRVDVLVHAAGALHLGDLADAGADVLDELYRINVRAPFLLTRMLLPALAISHGQIVFVNSSAAFRPSAENALYAATKAALRSLAESLRQRVNPLGIRVLSVFPGRTATPMQERVQAFEGTSYDPASLLQPADVASVVCHALMLPRTAEVTDLMVRPMLHPVGEARSP